MSFEVIHIGGLSLEKISKMCILICSWLSADVFLGIQKSGRSLQEFKEKSWNFRVQKTFEQQFCFTCEVFCPIGSDMFCTLCDSLGRSFVFACSKYLSRKSISQNFRMQIKIPVATTRVQSQWRVGQRCHSFWQKFAGNTFRACIIINSNIFHINIENISSCFLNIVMVIIALF